MKIPIVFVSAIAVTISHAMNQLDNQLIEAIQNQKEEQIIALLEQGAHPNTCINGLNALHAAAKIGRTPVIPILIERGANIDAVAPAYLNGTALSLAVYHGYIDTVQALLAHKANPNHQLSDTKMTPLHIAAMKGKDKIVQLLLAAGANPHAKNKENCTPLSMVAEAGKYELIQFMNVVEQPQKPHRKPEILVVAQNNLVQTAQVLLEHGAVIDHAPIKGTALHIAARNRHADLVQFLIEQGADLFARRPIMATPLHEMVVGLAIEVARNPKDISRALPLLHAFMGTPSKSVWREARVAVFSFACSLALMHTKKTGLINQPLPKDLRNLLYQYGIIHFVADFQLKNLQKALSLKMKFAGHEFTPAQLAVAQSKNGDIPALKELAMLLAPEKVEQYRHIITEKLLNKIKL